MGWFKWVRNDEVVVSEAAVQDAVENGVLTKAAQELLSEETGIKIVKPVGRQRKTKKK